MKKGKKIKLKIVTAYINQFQENEKRPKSVYKFCKHAKIDEKDFYASFSSLNQIESFFWKHLFKASLKEDPSLDNAKEIAL